MTDALQLAELTFLGKMNSIVQILTFAIILLLPVLCFTLKHLKKEVIHSRNAKIKLVAKERKHSQLLEKFVDFWMTMWIPAFIVLRNKVLFFTMVTPFILWRFYRVIKYRHINSCFKNLLRFLSQTCWLTYHNTFLALWIIEIINSKTDDTARK